MQKLKTLIFIVCLFNLSMCEILVETRSGLIQSTAALTNDVEAFLGIPYAEPPLGDLRFAKPVPKRPWTEIYHASNLPPPCLQKPLPVEFYFMGDLSSMSEDCLYLNVWKPKVDLVGDLRPVIINIHHGAFTHGSSSWKIFDGSHLASTGDVVVVTMNYRLGSLGFFLAFIEEADGSMGMYDQLMAIQWVKDNVESFGGDPENIILMGGSAGALSIGVHLVSPLSQNLVRRAILTSGSIINPLFLDGNNILFKTCEKIASIAGCTNKSLTLSSDPRSVVKCLKGKPAEILIDADFTLLRMNPISFMPRVGDEFLPKDAGLMYREGKFSRDVDIMYGTGTNEGGLMLAGFLHAYVGTDGSIPFRSMTKSRAAMIGRLGASMGGIKDPTDIVNFYINKVRKGTPEEYIEILTRGVGDFAVACGTVFLSDFLSLKGNRVYYYKFGFRAASTPMPEWVGTSHLDDIQYIFANPYHANFTSEEEELSNRLMKRISSFAKTGNPNVPGQMQWLQYSYQDPLYLLIGQEEESLRLKPYDNCKIWRKRFKSEINPGLFRVLQHSSFSSGGGGAKPKTDFSICLLLVGMCLILSHGLGSVRHHLHSTSDLNDSWTEETDYCQEMKTISNPGVRFSLSVDNVNRWQVSNVDVRVTPYTCLFTSQSGDKFCIE